MDTHPLKIYRDRVHEIRMRRALMALRDGALTPHDELRLNRHLTSCALCRATLSAWDRTDTGLRAARPDPVTLEPDRARAILERALLQAHAPPPRVPHHNIWIATCAASALLVVALMFRQSLPHSGEHGAIPGVAPAPDQTVSSARSRHALAVGDSHPGDHEGAPRPRSRALPNGRVSPLPRSSVATSGSRLHHTHLSVPQGTVSLQVATALAGGHRTPAGIVGHGAAGSGRDVQHRRAADGEVRIASSAMAGVQRPDAHRKADVSQLDLAYGGPQSSLSTGNRRSGTPAPEPRTYATLQSVPAAPAVAHPPVADAYRLSAAQPAGLPQQDRPALAENNTLQSTENLAARTLWQQVAPGTQGAEAQETLVKRAANRLSETIGREQATARFAPLKQPVVVTLADATVRQAADAISQASGVKVEVDRQVPAGTRLTIEAQGTPLAVVLETVGKQSGLMISPGANGVVLEPWPSLVLNGRRSTFRGSLAPWSTAWAIGSDITLAEAPHPAAGPTAMGGFGGGGGGFAAGGFRRDSGMAVTAPGSAGSIRAMAPLPALTPRLRAGLRSPLDDAVAKADSNVRSRGSRPQASKQAPVLFSGNGPALITRLSDRSFVVAEPVTSENGESGTMVTIYLLEDGRLHRMTSTYHPQN